MAPPFINVRAGDERLDRSRQLVQRQLMQRRAQAQAAQGRMGPGGVGNFARQAAKKARAVLGPRPMAGGRGAGPLGLARGHGARHEFTDVGFEFPGNPTPPGLDGQPNPGMERAWGEAAVQRPGQSMRPYYPAGLFDFGPEHPAFSQEQRQALMGIGQQQTLQQSPLTQELFQGAQGAGGGPPAAAQPGMSGTMIPIGGGMYYNPVTQTYHGQPGQLGMM